MNSATPTGYRMVSDRLRPATAPFRRLVASAAGLLVVGCLGGVGLAAAQHSSLFDPGPPQQLMFAEHTDAVREARLRSEPVEPNGPPLAMAGKDDRTEPSEPGRVPVPIGTLDQPFLPLPDDDTVRAVRTKSGVVLAVLDPPGQNRSDEVLVMTACQNTIRLSPADVEPVGRAHVVLDPGHGGTEVGAVGPSGLTEKDINLRVAKATQRRLEGLGAIVVLSRNFDHNLTTAARGRLAAAINPGLFLSIHHNGGAPPSGDRPGVMAFAKADSQRSRHFGGLFYHRFTTLLDQVAATRTEAYERYRLALDDYARQVADYDRRVAEWRAASETESEPGTVTTVPEPATTVIDGVMVAVPRAEVPEVGPPPALPDLQPVRELVFAGGGNHGVRSWIRPDGQDYLSILRTSEDVPAVLAEFLYLTNPAEEELLLDPAFVEAQAEALTAAIVDFFSGPDVGTTSGYVDDQTGDQPIGGGGRPENCVEPDYGIGERSSITVVDANSTR